jgi:hypothetical protein
MTSIKAEGSTRCGGGAGARESDRLAGAIDFQTKQSPRERQRAFAFALLRDERRGPAWDGSSRVRWQTLAGRGRTA